MSPDMEAVAARLERAALIEALGNMNHRAQREFPVVERFAADPPTPWTIRHRAINDLLDLLEMCGS